MSSESHSKIEFDQDRRHSLHRVCADIAKAMHLQIHPDPSTSSQNDVSLYSEPQIFSSADHLGAGDPLTFCDTMKESCHSARTHYTVCIVNGKQLEQEFPNILDFDECDESLASLTEVLNYCPETRVGAEDRFVACYDGYKVPQAKYVLEENGNSQRIWHEDATWIKTVRCKLRLCKTIPLTDELEEKNQQTSQYKMWTTYIAMILNRMIVVSGGLQYQGAGNNQLAEGIVGLQTIKEMVEWRYRTLELVTELGDGNHAVFEGYGDISCTKDGLLLDGQRVGSTIYLNPRNWLSKSDLVRGLVSWVNINSMQNANQAERYSVADMLLHADLSPAGISQWCVFTIEFDRHRDKASTIAFLGLIRFLYTRQHLRGELVCDCLCGNKFLEDCKQVDEVELVDCIPRLLGLQYVYETAYDIYTDAITNKQVNEVSEHKRPVPTLGQMSFAGQKVARSERTVSGITTSAPNGNEWTAGSDGRKEIGFEVDKDSLLRRLFVRDGEVFCVKARDALELRRLLKRRSVENEAVDETAFSNAMKLADAYGEVAIKQALGGEYGEEPCLQMVEWLLRGVVEISAESTASWLVPESRQGGSRVVDQGIGANVCAGMLFGRTEDELFWFPGVGLPCFLVWWDGNEDSGYSLTKIEALPEEAEVCHANISRDFGTSKVEGRSPLEPSS